MISCIKVLLYHCNKIRKTDNLFTIIEIGILFLYDMYIENLIVNRIFETKVL